MSSSQITEEGRLRDAMLLSCQATLGWGRRGARYLDLVPLLVLRCLL